MDNNRKKIPEQVTRLSVILLLIVVFIIVITSVLIPPDFGEHGHFRSSALEEIISQKLHYAGQEVCNECHDDIMEIKNKSYHKNISCEVCHGPAIEHTEEPGDFEPRAPRGRNYCPLCHEYLPSRPTGFPQIISDSHNPVKPCITCHDPHDPVPPETPRECMACHAEIARTKLISHHAYVQCIRCHVTPENHKLNPRDFFPSKPNNREFCGQCHAEDATSEKGIPRIDISSHGERYVCWQCHYPHLPEASQ
jgi:hypothetical protein